jgi:hypothetical protein
MNTKAKGELTEGIILAELLRQGYAVSLPFGDNQRYDLIIDDGRRLWKAQCKTGHLVNGCVSFQVSSKNGFTKQRKAYHGQVDIFFVYCPETNTVYRIPPEITGKNERRLRVTSNRGGAVSRIKWAKDFLVCPAST